MYFNEKTISSDSANDKSWESGVRFVEQRKSKKIIKFIAFVLIIIVSASVGGVIGGYYVKNNYFPSYGDINASNGGMNNLNDTGKTADIPKNSITKVSETVGPAVVGVNNIGEGWSGESSLQGSGSGIIFDKAGYIVTNYHVIEGASKVTVSLSGGRKIPARIIGRDSRTDLAVLKINVQNLPVAKFGDSSKIRVGDTSIAIGNPLGEEFAGTVTAGVISGLNRRINADDRTYRVIQTDASINPGNSGGALCNEAGEVIGINTIKIKSAEGIGFAIPINEAKAIIEKLMKNGYVSRPFIGIAGQFVDADMASVYNVPVGIFVNEVVQGSGAESSGIKPGDIIVSFDNAEIKKYEDFTETLSKHKVGDAVTAKVWRDGRYYQIKIKIGDSMGN